MRLTREAKIVLVVLGIPLQLSILAISAGFGTDALFWTLLIFFPVILGLFILLVEQIGKVLEKSVQITYLLLSTFLAGISGFTTNSIQGIKAVYNTLLSIIYNPFNVTINGLINWGRLFLDYILKKWRSESPGKYEKLPGIKLLKLAKYICSAKGYNHSFEPTVGDWQAEYLEIIKLNTISFMPDSQEEKDSSGNPHKIRQHFTDEGKLKVEALNSEYSWRYVLLIAEHNILTTAIRYLMAASGK